MSHTHRTRGLVYVMSKHLCLPLLGLILFSPGCISRSTRKTSSINHYKNVEVSAGELGSRNQSLLALYSSEIEGAADKIILESPSPVTRREALVWKAEAIPILQRSALNTNPVAAVVDTWTFIFQMNAYMEQSLMKNRFGVFLSVVSDTLKQMDTEMEQLVLAAAPAANIPDLRRKLGEWAAAHPIQTGLSGRRSADNDLIKQADQSDWGALASLNALQQGLGDITARLDNYNAYLPKQARWQAELLIGDLAHDPQLGAAASNFAVLTRAVDKTSNDLDRIPELVGTARNIALADVENQRLAAQSFLTGERAQVIEALAGQRIAAIADLRGERLAATADLRAERQIVLDAVHQEQIAAMKDLNAVGEQAINDLDKRSRRLVDHFFWRAIELVVITLLLSLLLVWILLRRLTSRGLSPRREEYRRAA
jgi:hypothetical protein